MRAAPLTSKFLIPMLDANNANGASKAQQIAIAEKVKADRGGYGAWPVCGKKA